MLLLESLELKADIMYGLPPNCQIYFENVIWLKARSTNLKEDWLIFRQLCNVSTAAIRKAKVDYFLLETSNNLNNLKTFWKNIKYLIGNKSNSDFL